MAIVKSDSARTPLSLSCPVESLASFVGSWPDAAILESGPGFGSAGRWSYYAAGPRLVFEATGSDWTIFEVGWDRVQPPMRWTSEPIDRGEGDVLEALGRWIECLGLKEMASDDDPDRPPFTGGLIGYLGYDLAPGIEDLPRKAPRDSRLPDCRFALYENVVTVDHRTGAVDLWSNRFPRVGPRAQTYGTVFSTGIHHARPRRVERSRLGPLTSNFTREDYREAVGRALEYIRAGDAFQVNLSQRFSATGTIHPIDLYQRLRTTSPAPFSGLLRFRENAIISASPELFYETRGHRIVTRPIKGTRPRGHSFEEDARLAEELCHSPKDRAELTMIVDLERNDLGRVCEYGSVKVTDALSVESFAQVHHLVATVEGRLRPEIGPIDVVKALFPGGSITGAPKIRAMQIIDELEPSRRGVYTGAIGYFGRGGNSAFNIAIRTMIVEGDRVSYQVGGGIVADSDPLAEYEETLHKGRAMREILEGAG